MANSVFLWWGTGQVIVGPITIQGNVIPSADNTYDLGTSSFQWHTVYLGTSAQLASAATVQWSTDLTLKRIAAGQLGLQKDSTHGVTLDVATDATLKVLDRAGTGSATVAANFFQVGANAGLSGSGNTGELVARNAANASNGFFSGNKFVADAGGNFRFSSSTVFLDVSDGVWRALNNAATTGVTFNVATDATLKLFARDGSSAATLQVASIKMTTATAFASGDKYVIVDSSGNFHVSALGPAS